MYIDLTPDNNLEKRFFSEIASCLNIDITVVAKNFGDVLPDTEEEKIILMNADESYRIPEEINDPSVKLIFKQYCYEGQHPKLRPLPLGPSKDFVVTEKNILERNFDVSFVGQVANNRFALYKEIPQFLMDDSINSFFGLYQGFNRGLDCESYSKILCDTKIAICPHGTSSPESFRFFEACAASCVILTVSQPDNWVYKNAPYIPLQNVYPTVKTILTNPDKLRTISEATKRYHRENISPKAVSQYIEGEINECRNSR